MAQNMRVQYVQFYTGGSAARKLDIPTPKAAPKPRTKKQKRILVHIDPIAILGIMVAAVMLILMAVGFSKLEDTRQEAQQMESYVSSLRRENAALQEQYITGFDPEQVERTALGLGMIPQEQAEHVSIPVSVMKEESQPNAWDSIITFLTGLFA